MSISAYLPPPKDCLLCPRLAAFRAQNRIALPACYNGAVPSFGELSARILVIGLGPGLKGANCSGRPFTGDYAGLVLYASLLKHGLASGQYIDFAGEGLSRFTLETRRDGPIDTLSLHDCRITNAVRCVPPENKPETSEIRTCNAFLKDEIGAMPKLKVILTLGLVSHNATLRALGQRQSAAKFSHAAEHRIGGHVVLNSYHCSRYNINTGSLTQAMFDDVVGRAKELADR